MFFIRGLTNCRSGNSSIKGGLGGIGNLPGPKSSIPLARPSSAASTPAGQQRPVRMPGATLGRRHGMNYDRIAGARLAMELWVESEPEIYDLNGNGWILIHCCFQHAFYPGTNYHGS